MDELLMVASLILMKHKKLEMNDEKSLTCGSSLTRTYSLCLRHPSNEENW